MPASMSRLYLCLTILTGILVMSSLSIGLLKVSLCRTWRASGIAMPNYLRNSFACLTSAASSLSKIYASYIYIRMQTLSRSEPTLAATLSRWPELTLFLCSWLRLFCAWLRFFCLMMTESSEEFDESSGAWRYISSIMSRPKCLRASSTSSRASRTSSGERPAWGLLLLFWIAFITFSSVRLMISRQISSGTISSVSAFTSSVGSKFCSTRCWSSWDAAWTSLCRREFLYSVCVFVAFIYLRAFNLIFVVIGKICYLADAYLTCYLENSFES